MSNEYVNIKTDSLNKNVPTKETLEDLISSKTDVISELITLKSTNWNKTANN